MRLGVLSAGQKVKVVLGAATWHSPHILILDEPTNYLDRESLGGLASALKEFKGGVIVVSHSREFCHTVCDERWVMDTGRLSREGQIEKEDVRIDRSELAQSFFDESGNLHERPRSLGSSSRDLKRHRRQKALRKKRGEEVSSDEDLVS
uniref:ABC transporter domain-containing protein n=1 Tax=Alexandrium andersonii TaxID=327968 RepID=A0A7S2I052_9DINO|mmetsp:Transcript_77115/g.172553  ORF Transcript_77115/g.172553 Transcript_77115/m.172553 type:complete len:149 (+) Transcript_77115:1-447(+)